jgi:hypothetical protein
MLVFIELGWRFGRRAQRPTPESGTAAIEGAVFGLFGLLIAFTFSGATSRFEARRQLILTEANAIGTAWLRIDLLPVEAQPPLREHLREYLDARIEAFRALPDAEAAARASSTATALQALIWSKAVEATKAQGLAVGTTGLVIDSLNTMFDITTTRAMAMRQHPPVIIYVMLFGLALVSALFAGFGIAAGGSRRKLHAAIYALVIACTVYVDFDIEYPRQGLVRIDAFDEVLLELRSSMQPK